MGGFRINPKGQENPLGGGFQTGGFRINPKGQRILGGGFQTGQRDNKFGRQIRHLFGLKMPDPVVKRTESVETPTRMSPFNWIDKEPIEYIKADGTTQVFNANIEARIPLQFSYSTSENVVSPDWKHLAILTSKGLAIVSNFGKSREPKYIYTGKIPVEKVKWSHHNQSIAYTLANGDIHVYDLPKETTITLRGHTALVNAIEWSPDGTHITSISSDRIKNMWNALSKETISTVINNIDPKNALLVFSPDDKYIATAETDNTVLVTEHETGREFRFHGHTAPVYAIEWSPEGTRIASVSNDGTIRVWKVPPHRLNASNR
jgi:WD40 repeat protein